MDISLTGKKRNRSYNEDLKYSKINTPDMFESPINYFLSQIIKEYDEGISYCFSFDGYSDDDIIVSCIWGFLPIYDGALANFTKKVKIEDIASYVNFGKIERVFQFFSNIQCLINVDNDTLKKLSFFENGKYGFIYRGAKDYYLMMNIKSLDKFDFIDKNNDYCQFWLIKIDDLKFLETLGLKSTNEKVLELSNKILELNNIIEEKNSYFQKERMEYNDRIKKLMKDKEKELELLEEKYNNEKKEKMDLIEQFKNENKNRIKRARKFLGLKTFKDCFSIIVENPVVSFEEVSDHPIEEEKLNEKFECYTCMLCAIRPRNVFFDKCGHCCFCEECLEKCLHKFNKKKKISEYFCPICSNTQENKEENNNYSGIRKIFYC